MDLASLGWSEFFARAFAAHAAAGHVPARVALEHKHAYALLAEQGEVTAELLGRMLQEKNRANLPAVGDWVAIEQRTRDGHASIHAVLPRRTCFSRRAPGEHGGEQVVAANIDTVFLVTGLDADFNLRRMERYLALARGSGAEPVVVLNKIDLCLNPGLRLDQARQVAAGVPVHAMSAAAGQGMDVLAPYLSAGQTIAVLGSSGVGKSTLVNQLLGAARQAVSHVRQHDERGRHTTARRELIVLPGGALLIDTPGMREIQLWDSGGGGLLAAFPEVLELAGACRFRDCRHESEPDCAVQAALRSGALPRDRFASFLKLRREVEAQDAGASGSVRAPRVKGRRIMRG